MKPNPHNLQELRLVGCKTSDKYVNQLVEFLAYEDINLKSLGLVKMCLSSIGMDHICDYLERAYWLEDLDLSYNDFRSFDFRRFMQLLAKNKSLKTLNLSMNPLLSLRESKEPGIFIVKSKQERLEEKTMLFLKNKGVMEDPLEGNNHPELVIAALSSFIRNNKQLLHLDIMNTGLSERVITSLAQPLRHAKSLLSAHIGMNPGTTIKSKEFLRERLNC